MSDLIILLMLTMWPAAAAVTWVRVDTPHFVVFGQVDEKKTRGIATEFERFREAIRRVLPIAAVESPVPTMVVLFDNERSLAPFAPRFNGNPIKVNGFFQGTEIDNVIALSLEKREQALRIVFHEYTHLVISGTEGTLPAWVNEGLAEYYSTFEMREDGRGGVSGRPIISHLALLNERKLLTIDELIGVQRDSPLYNEGERRSMFYAQSWALVHMLVSKSARADAFKRYLALSAQGTSPREAWTQVFGSINVMAELETYVRGLSMTGFVYGFDEIKAPPMSSSTPSAADAETAMAILLRRIDPQDALFRLERVAAAQPASKLALAVLGLMKVETSPEAAERMLLEATRDPADWLTQYYAAAGLANLVSGSMLESDRPRFMAARAALKFVMGARPDLAHAHALMTFVADPDQTIASITKARQMAPGRTDYLLLEAQARANQEQFASARDVLAPLLTGRYSAEDRDRARQLMADIEIRERSSSQFARPSPPAQPSPANPVRAVEQEPPPLPPRPPPSSPIRVDELESGRSRATYRTTKRGETRVEGRLTRILCERAGAVIFAVRIAGVLQHFSARALRDVEFFTYREMSPGPVACGLRKRAERVFVTWTPWSPAVKNIAGRVTAVEFLPEK